MPFRFSFSSHWPGPRSLATTNGVSVDVLSSSYLDVSVRSVRLILLCIQKMISLNAMGCPIRKSTDQSLLTAPRGLSQPATSFFASECQGIHQMPFFYFIRSQKTEDRFEKIKMISPNPEEKTNLRSTFPFFPYLLSTRQKQKK